MTATTAPPLTGAAERSPDRMPRFAGAERLVHWATALPMLVLVVTGLVLYVGQLEALVGRRELVRTIHVWSGLLLLGPLVVGLLGPWRRPLVTDLRRLSRWTLADRQWLRRSRRADASTRMGKFNAGQKVFGAFVGGAMPVMLASGSIMHWFKPFSDDWRTGATFVHDWVAIGLFIAIPIHVFKALSEPILLRAMVLGWVPRRWAELHRPAWFAELSATADGTKDVDPAG
jgi:formate dehydrogenase subunit gamma